MDDTVDLPVAYEPRAVDAGTPVFAEARRLALAGAEEGTLVWARDQRTAFGPAGHGWQPAPEGLYCALVLRPDIPAPATAQLVAVAAVSVGGALAELVSPLTQLHYRWPGGILLNQGKAAGIRLAADPDTASPWAILGIGVNVTTAPADLGFAAASVRQEGDCDAAPEQVLEGFTRHFLAWINRWAEDGFAPVRHAWLQRMPGLNESRQVHCHGDTAAGIAETVDENGSLVLRHTDGGQQVLSLSGYYGLTDEPVR